MTSSAPSLSSLSSHSIFTPPKSTLDEEWEVVDRPSDVTIGTKSSRLVVRDKDLVVAVDREVRMSSLSHGLETGDGKSGSYKTLVSPQLGFQVSSLVLNPTGRLLAVVGKSQVTVIALPKSSALGTETGDLSVYSFAIDEYEFSATSSVEITKVLWHPWGEHGNSLWILTSDGRLREYYVDKAQDPTQEYTFLPALTASKSRFTAVDPLSRYATSFSFMPATLDFGPTIVQVLCANGDLYIMGPILPLHALVPLKWLHAVKIVADSTGGLKAQWVDNLFKQVKADQDRKKMEEEFMLTPSRRASVLGKKREEETKAEPQEATAEETVRLHPPHLTESGGPAPGLHRSLLRQGPVVFDPAPEDLGAAEDDEDVASDITAFEAGEQGETVVAIAWSGGRVDLGLVVDTPQPRWVSSKDQSDEEPSLTIIESVVLPLPSFDFAAIDSNAPVFFSDPIHRDVVYVQHTFGVDAISVRPWIAALETDEEDLPSSEVVRVVESAGSPVKPIIGAFTLCSLSLGYTVLALASSYRLATVELDFHVEDPVPEEKPAQPAAEEPVKHDPASLILAKPLKYDDLIANSKGKQADYRAMARNVSVSPMNTFSGGQLRAIADIISSIQSRLEAVRAASVALENHLDLCVKEFQRQIKLVKASKEGIEEVRDTKIPVKALQMLDRQSELAKRLDKLLSGLVKHYGPDVGEVEKKWFAELEQLKEKVKGSENEPGLEDKVKQLREQLAKVKPSVEAAVKSEPEDPSTKAARQLRPLEQALGERGEQIRDLIKRVESLTTRLDAAVGL